MKDAATLLEAISSLAWPILVGFIVYHLRDSIKSIAKTAESRRFTIKVAGNELTMEEVTNQQRKILSDLQEQLLATQREIGLLETSSEGRGEQARERRAEPKAIPRVKTDNKSNTKSKKRILWVDDNPRGNSTLRANISELGIEVVTAVSTEEGLKKLSSKEPFDRIITDMGRAEQSGYNATAGIDLIKAVRTRDQQIPILVYTGHSSLDDHGLAAMAAGAKVVTASPMVLLRSLDLTPERDDVK